MQRENLKEFLPSGNDHELFNVPQNSFAESTFFVQCGRQMTLSGQIMLIFYYSFDISGIYLMTCIGTIGKATQRFRARDRCLVTHDTLTKHVVVLYKCLQYWIIFHWIIFHLIICVLWQAYVGNFTRPAHELNRWHVFGYFSLKIIATSSRVQWAYKHQALILSHIAWKPLWWHV